VKATDPYSRIYWSVMHDDKFDGIREDVRLFGTWSLLLVVADMAWPSPAYLPRTIPKAALGRLVACELIDELPGHRFRVHGMDAERGKRQQYARNAAASRWQNEPDADAMPSNSQAKDEPRNSQEVSQGTADPADAYWQLTGKYPAGKALAWIDNLAGEFGAEATTEALAREFTANRNTADLLTRTQNVLRSGARKLSLKERAAEEARLAEKRAQPVKLEPWREEYRQRLEEHYREAS
jgi:hypothetical protein